MIWLKGLTTNLQQPIDLKTYPSKHNQQTINKKLKKINKIKIKRKWLKSPKVKVTKVKKLTTSTQSNLTTCKISKVGPLLLLFSFQRNPSPPRSPEREREREEMGNSLLKLISECFKPSATHEPQPQAPPGVSPAVSALAHDLLHFEITSQVRILFAF